MKEQVLRFVGAVLLTILAVLGVGAILHILVTLPFEGKGPEWVTALGTIGTLIGTIYLARTETRRRESRERVVGRIHARANMIRCEQASASIEEVMHILKQAKSRNEFSIKLDECQRRLVGIYPWTMEELAPLVALSGDIAPKIIDAIEALQKAQAALKSFVATHGQHGTPMHPSVAFTFYKDLARSEALFRNAACACTDSPTPITFNVHGNVIAHMNAVFPEFFRREQPE